MSFLQCFWLHSPIFVFCFHFVFSTCSAFTFQPYQHSEKRSLPKHLHISSTASCLQQTRNPMYLSSFQAHYISPLFELSAFSHSTSSVLPRGKLLSASFQVVHVVLSQTISTYSGTMLFIFSPQSRNICSSNLVNPSIPKMEVLDACF